MGDRSPGHKQNPAAHTRVATASTRATMNRESVCKWKALNLLYDPDDEEWVAATEADRWDSPDIAEWIKIKLDEAWAAEQASYSRRRTEAEEEQKRIAAAAKRTQQRYQAATPLRTFVQKKNLSIIHESSKPKPPDPLASLNPLSQQYEKRPRKKRASRSPSPSPSPDEDLAEEAAEKGIEIVAKHKEKRQKTARGDDANAIAAAKRALNALTPAMRKTLLEGNESEEEEKKSVPSRAKIMAAAAGRGRAIDPSVFFKTKLALINKERVKRGHGHMNAASRSYLRELSDIHAKNGENPNDERGFAGSALSRQWYTQFVEDIDKYPDDSGSEEY